MGDCGDECGTVGLGATACLGVTKRNDNLADGHISTWADIPGGYQDLVHSRDDQQFFAVTGADGQSVPGIGGVPPRATVILLQGNCLTYVLTQQLRGDDSGYTGGPVVGIDDKRLVVGDQQPVGVLVTNIEEPPGGTLGSRSLGPLSHTETLSNVDRLYRMPTAFLRISGLVHTKGRGHGQVQ